ncbi:LytR C-terminal domain-containing protein [Cryobacterium sp. W22_MBD10_FK3]|uniref:LytR C-terminal domain-containing protein n=1 Tax=Cryobacterium sp. W22_MBD10_FK3 TaxID=3240273 RepID=UPI003F8F2E9A
MPTSYPKDRFDHLPHKLERVGAHRAPAKKGRRWVAFWWALAATALLVGVGAVGLSVLNNRLNFTIPGVEAETPVAEPTAEPVPTAEPTTDPNARVTVLNGTPTTGVARSVGEVLTDGGWTVGSTSDADTEDFATTTVYYADPTLEGAARGVAALLPGSAVLLSEDFAGSDATLTVVVGADYVMPAG